MLTKHYRRIALFSLIALAVGLIGIQFAAARISNPGSSSGGSLSPIGANSVLANSTGASAVPTAVATSSLFTLSPGLSQTSAKLLQVENRGFSYATSTAWTGTTTVSLGVGYGEAWNTAKCFTDTGTLAVDFYHASTHFPNFNASTTIGVVSMGSSIDTSGDKVLVDLGTPVSAPTKITCTVNDTI